MSEMIRIMSAMLVFRVHEWRGVAESFSETPRDTSTFLPDNVEL